MSNKVEATFHGGEVKEARDLRGRDVGAKVAVAVNDKRRQGGVRGILTGVVHESNQVSVFIDARMFTVDPNAPVVVVETPSTP